MGWARPSEEYRLRIVMMHEWPRVQVQWRTCCSLSSLPGRGSPTPRQQLLLLGECSGEAGILKRGTGWALRGGASRQIWMENDTMMKMKMKMMKMMKMKRS